MILSSVLREWEVHLIWLRWVQVTKLLGYIDTFMFHRFTSFDETALGISSTSMQNCALQCL